jgi:hypothetical protein
MADEANSPLVLQHRASALSVAACFTSRPADELKAAAEARMAFLSMACESPIEEIFAWYWVVWTECCPFGEMPLVLVPQFWFDDRDFGRYRFDFAVSNYRTGRKVAIELDGHEWHERTREQVEARNLRDRRMQLHNWKIIHYSGAEVIRDGIGAAATAWHLAVHTNNDISTGETPGQERQPRGDF